MAANPISKDSIAWLSSARRFSAVTPSDSVDLAPGVRAIFVGTGGDIALVGEDDNVEVLKNVADGMIIDVSPKRVNDTDTTADDIVAFY
jgi:hypothetical protein